MGPRRTYKMITGYRLMIVGLLACALLLGAAGSGACGVLAVGGREPKRGERF